MTTIHTPEQLAILDAGRTSDNLQINALAGTGKTSMLELLEGVLPTKPVLYLAFNRKVVEDASKRMSSTTTVRSFNGIGHRIWGHGRSISLNAKKSQTIFRQIVDEAPKSQREAMWEVYFPVLDGVDRAKCFGYVPECAFPQAKRLISTADFHRSLEETPDDLTIRLIDEVLFRSIKAAYQGKIDFNDQLYMPALFGGVFPKFPTVLVDEAQDLNPVQHELLRRLVTRRIIAVGDPWQSIYAFRGAVSGGMRELSHQFKMTEFPLSISFRCPSAIVRNVHWRVPHFRWHREGGRVETLSSISPSDLPDEAAVICRNNAPLFSAALRTLSAGRSISVVGSDIGPRLVGTMRRLGDEGMTQAQTLEAIDWWLEEKLAKESKTAIDMANCMRVFASVAGTLSGAIATAEHIFAQRGRITFSTGHRAKGLEWDHVYHLDQHLIGHDEQESNLRYVIDTRAKDSLYMITNEGLQ